MARKSSAGNCRRSYRVDPVVHVLAAGAQHQGDCQDCPHHGDMHAVASEVPKVLGGIVSEVQLLYRKSLHGHHLQRMNVSPPLKIEHGRTGGEGGDVPISSATSHTQGRIGVDNQHATVGPVRLVNSVQEIPLSGSRDIPHVWGSVSCSLCKVGLALRRWWDPAFSDQRLLEGLVGFPPGATPALPTITTPTRMGRARCCRGTAARQHRQSLPLAAELQEVRGVLRQQEVLVRARGWCFHGLYDPEHDFLQLLVRANIQAQAVLLNHQNVHPGSPHWIHEVTRAQIPKHRDPVPRHITQLLHHLVQAPFLLDPLHILNDCSPRPHLPNRVHHGEKRTRLLLFKSLALHVQPGERVAREPTDIQVNIRRQARPGKRQNVRQLWGRSILEFALEHVREQVLGSEIAGYEPLAASVHVTGRHNIQVESGPPGVRHRLLQLVQRHHRRLCPAAVRHHPHCPGSRDPRPELLVERHWPVQPRAPGLRGRLGPADLGLRMRNGLVVEGGHGRHGLGGLHGGTPR
mmetsp:Transcript_33572/g.73368  ORF Transcript_33572/g.73368 Transcript_33572/m.73368 type:complete len:518 (+) Transcript_33572:222-1775(+)